VPDPFTILKDKVVSGQFLQFRQPTSFSGNMLEVTYDENKRQDILLL
jgi:hypothetical protein